MFKGKISYIKNEFKWKVFCLEFLLFSFLGVIIDFIFLFLLNIFDHWSTITLEKLIKINFTQLISKHFLIFIIFQFVLIALILILSFGFTLKGKKGSKFLSYEKKNKEYGISEFLIDETKNVPYENQKKFNLVYPKYFTEPFWIVKSSFNEKKQQLDFNGITTKSAIHVLVIGSTGSGKTQKFIIPNAILNARLPQKEKPSMVFTDPKGELFATVGGELEKQGYQVMKLNLRNVMDSIRYNPLANVWDFFVKGLNYEKDNFSLFLKKDFLKNNQTQNFKCLFHNELGCEDCFFDSEKEIWVDNLEKYFFIDEKTKNDYLFLKKSSLSNKAYEEIEDLTDVLCNPGAEMQNKSFYQGAQGLIKGVILVFLELKTLGVSITKEQFNMITIAKLISNQEKLTKWFENYGKKHETSSAFQAASGVINASEGARGNFYSMAKNCLKIFEDESLKHILVDNDLDFFEFANVHQPKALFLIIPDDRRDKHPIASLFISQLYKGSTFAASQNLVKKGKDELDRSVLFFLDEFGNIPKISQFENIITVARSRRMYFALVIQDFQQLQNNYGENAETIKANCPLTIYLKSTSTKTLKEISERMGETTILTKALTGDAEKDKTAAVSMHGKPLMEAGDIGHLKSLYSIILYAKQMPSIVKFELAYKVSQILNLKARLNQGLTPKPVDFENKYWLNLFRVDLNQVKKVNKRSNLKFEQQISKKVKNDHFQKIEKEIKELESKSFLTITDKKRLLELLEQKEKKASWEKEN